MMSALALLAATTVATTISAPAVGQVVMQGQAVVQGQGGDGAAQPAPPIDPEVARRIAAQQQLTSALARVAANSRDWNSLSIAGQSALVLGDPRAALGFLVRAEALAPQDATVKAALGAAMVQLENPEGAMRYFDAAVAAGGLDRAYLADRGLAFDMLGNQTRAQGDYAVAMQSAPSDELTRRMAISLGISGQSERAVQLLAPLLRTQDRAAWRSRAMIVAMNGHAEEARQIAQATMPAQLAQGLDPYFGLMDRLTPAQLAAASHFGRFPTYETLRGQPSRSAARTALASAATAGAGNGRTRDRSARGRGRAAR
ncbi:MAG: tetratricopeptide repeat protein, partial [Sphingopyxis sp.]